MSFFPAVYDNSPESLISIEQSYPFHTILLHENARKFTKHIRENYPEVFIIHRIWVDDRMDGWLRDKQYHNGAYLAELIYNSWDDKADAYISLNEPSIETFFNANDVALFDAGFTDKMNGYGKIALVGGFSSGAPEEDVLEHYLNEFIQNLNNIQQDNWAMHFHAYGPNLIFDTEAPSDLMTWHSEDNAQRFLRRWKKVLGYLPPCFVTEIGPSGYAPGLIDGEYGWIGRHDQGLVIADSEAWAGVAEEVEEIIGYADFCIGNSGNWPKFNVNGTLIPVTRSFWNRTYARVRITSGWSVQDHIKLIHAKHRDVLGLNGTVMIGNPSNIVSGNTTPDFNDDAAMLQYLKDKFGDSLTEWENSGGLLDNWSVWLAAVGKIDINNQDWLTWLLTRSQRRVDSSNEEHSKLNDQQIEMLDARNI